MQPELLKPASAADLLDISPSTFRAIFPVLAAHHGLKVYAVAGPKFRRENLLAVIDRLQSLGLDVVCDKANGVVRIGDVQHPITSGRITRRGRRSA